MSALLTLRPLIDKGICTFVDNRNYNFCHSCYSKGLRGAFGGEDVDVFFRLLKDFAAHTTITYDGTIKGKRSFSIKGDEDKLGHDIGGGYTTREPLPKRLRRGSVLSKELVLSMGFANGFAYYSANDLVQANSIASQFGHDSIWSSSPQMSIMKQVFGNYPIGDEVQINYPLLSAQHLGAVLDFREREWHHLVDFRDFLAQATSSGELKTSQLDAELAKIERATAKARRGLNKRIISEVVGAGVTIGATIASAGISQVLAIILGALSGGHIVKNLIPDILDRISDAEEARDSKVYYAWKVRQRRH